jgi:hypothetical protein
MGDEGFAFCASIDFLNKVENYYNGLLVHMGKKDVKNGDTISHGLTATPDYVFCTPTSGNRSLGVGSLGASTFTMAMQEKTFGKATVPAGTGQVTVTHNLSGTPGSVQCTPKANATFWVSNTNATTFRINLIDYVTGVAPVGAVDVYWHCDKNIGSTEEVHWMAMGDHQGPLPAPV